MRLTQEGYASLASDEQVTLLRSVARTGSARFGLDVETIELVRHEFNTTFRVADLTGRVTAVRVNTNSVSTPEHVIAQHAWMRALAAQTPVRLPVPLRTLNGDEHAVVPTPHGMFMVVAATWLDGKAEPHESPLVMTFWTARTIGPLNASPSGQAQK